MKTPKDVVMVLGTVALLIGACGTRADQSNDQRGSNVVPGSAVSGVQAVAPAPSAREREARAIPMPPNPREGVRNEPPSAPTCPRCVSI